MRARDQVDARSCPITTDRSDASRPPSSWSSCSAAFRCRLSIDSLCGKLSGRRMGPQTMFGHAERLRECEDGPRLAAKQPAQSLLRGLPPDLSADAGRGSFMTLLPKRRRYSFGFRPPTWHAPKILGLLADRNIALCISDHHVAPLYGNAPLTSSTCGAMVRAAACGNWLPSSAGSVKHRATWAQELVVVGFG